MGCGAGKHSRRLYNPRRVLFSEPIVASMGMFFCAAPHEKADLFYTGSDIKLFKLRERLQGGAPLQTGVEWQQAQARTQRSPGPTRIPMAPPVVVLDSACAATTAAPPLQITGGQLKRGVLDGSIPSAAYDTACTSNAGLEGDSFIPTDQPSNKMFTVATGHKNPGSRVAKLHHPVR